MKHIGIVACSAEGAALCYRTICAEATQKMGEHVHPEITMHTPPLSDYVAAIEKDDWQQVAELMLISTEKVAACGADFAICPDNTIHQAFPFLKDKSPIPWLHIAEVVAKEAQKNTFRRLAITGTKYLMTGPVYKDMLSKFDISCEIPSQDEREQIHQIIFTELLDGILREESRLYFNEVIQRLKGKGCDAVVLGCTAIPLIVNANDCPSTFE